MIKKLFILGVIAIPFNDFYPLLPLGELQYDLSIYVFFAMIGLMILEKFRPQLVTATGTNQNQMAISQPFANMAAVMFAVIVISFVMNMDAMFGGKYHGRYPIEKFLTSSATVIFCFSLAYVTYILSKRYDWHELVIRPVAISVAICSVVAMFEALAWTGGFFQKFYVIISQFFHMGYDFTFGVVGMSKAEWLLHGRARSICFEPPALANFAGFAWPWVYAGTFSAPVKNRPLYRLAWFLCTALVLLANSRTSLVLLFGNIVALFLLRFVYMPLNPLNRTTRQITTLLLIAGTIGAVVTFFMNTDVVAENVIKGDNVSNLTRFSSFMAGMSMFIHSPVWGYGFGQFGFHILDHLPTWGFYSWEIRAWTSPPYAMWPPAFSVYGRFAAELGILGVIAWLGIWITLARTVYRVALAYQMKTGNVLQMSIPIIMGCYSALLAGIALDSLRSPMMWITMGLACSFIYEVRSRLAKLNQNP